MKNIIVLMSLLLVAFGVKAQSFCSTPSNASNFLASLSKSQLTAIAPSYNVRVFAHIVRTSSGSGGMTPTELTAAIGMLNQDFGIHNICFTLVGTGYINDDGYFNNQLNTSIFGVSPTPNAIDIYFFPNSCPSPGGQAQGIGAKALVIGGTWNSLGTNVIVNTSHILSHEMGHCLGLFHTHHGTSNEGTPGECAELVNGSNCNSCGDFVCDTPADPHIHFDVNTNCTWLGNGTDTQGNSYAPNTHLIMAYTQPTCMQMLTPGEAQRMYGYLHNYSILQQVLIQGGCCSGNITFSGMYSTPLTQSATWIKSAGQTTSQSSSSVVLDADPTLGYILLAPAIGNDYFLSVPNATGKFVAQTLDGCGAAAPFAVRPNTGSEVVIEESTRKTLNQELQEPDLSIFPNPSHGLVSITLSGIETNAMRMEIRNLMGQIVLQDHLINGEKYQLNTSQMTSGVYFITAKDDIGQQVILKKLVIE